MWALTANTQRCPLRPGDSGGKYAWADVSLRRLALAPFPGFPRRLCPCMRQIPPTEALLAPSYDPDAPARSTPARLAMRESYPASRAHPAAYGIPYISLLLLLNISRA